MAPNLRLFDSDGAAAFSSHDFGRVVAGGSSPKKLIFVNSYGDVDAEDCEIGIYAVSGNDGDSFAQISGGEDFAANLSTLSATVDGGAGSIPDSATLKYKISVRDADGYESAANSNVVTPTLSAGNTNQVNLSWTAITGATDYRVYSSIDGGTTYKLKGTTANLTFTDNTGAEGLGAEPATDAVAYRITTWTTAPVSIGTLTIGSSFPVYIREVVPSNVSSTGNPRHHKTYLAFN